MVGRPTRRGERIWEARQESWDGSRAPQEGPVGSVGLGEVGSPSQRDGRGRGLPGGPGEIRKPSHIARRGREGRERMRSSPGVLGGVWGPFWTAVWGWDSQRRSEVPPEVLGRVGRSFRKAGRGHEALLGSWEGLRVLLGGPGGVGSGQEAHSDGWGFGSPPKRARRRQESLTEARGLRSPPRGSRGTRKPSCRAGRSRESLLVSREGVGRPE